MLGTSAPGKTEGFLFSVFVNRKSIHWVIHVIHVMFVNVERAE
jgi:hypothetical protein